jgi:hypothetical protein
MRAWIAALALAACQNASSPPPTTSGWWCYEFRSPQIAAGVCVRTREACEAAPQRQGDCAARDVVWCFHTPDDVDCAPSQEECEGRRADVNAHTACTASR